MESIIYRDPELEASFSFSCYDFNLAHLHVFSDDEGAGINDDEYIEIALEQPRLTYAGDEYDGSRDQELELRISFSSTSVPCSFLEINSNNNIGLSCTTTVESIVNESETVATPSSSSSSLSSTSTLSCSSAETCLAAGTEPSRLTTDHDKSSVKRRVQFRTVNRLLGGFLSSTPRTSSEMEGTITIDHESSRQMAIQNNINKLELLRSRRAAKMLTKTTSNGGMMMKFLIKCRSINIRAVLASFMKPYQVIISSPQNNSTSGSGSGGGQIKKKRSNKETTLSVGTVVKSMSTGFGWKDKLKRKSSSCCTSNKNSLLIQEENPAGGGSGDNSIQAAIAHCKRSFGHTSEFSF